MEAKGLRIEELRATNYVRYFDGKEGEVSELGNFSYFSWIEEDWSGIPLTEDWLIELGFENDIIKLKHGEFIQHEGCTFYLGGDSSVVNCQCFTVNVKYVHELQNLYFALTGKELKK